MTPLVWLAGVAPVPLLSGAYAFRENQVISTVLAIVGCVPLLVVCAVAFYWGFWKQSLFHSEEHLSLSRVHDIIEEKGMRIPINPLDLPAIANPYPSPAALPAHEVDEEQPLATEETDGSA
jgi:hypothetical protein